MGAGSSKHSINYPLLATPAELLLKCLTPFHNRNRSYQDFIFTDEKMRARRVKQFVQMHTAGKK